MSIALVMAFTPIASVLADDSTYTQSTESTVASTESTESTESTVDSVPQADNSTQVNSNAESDSTKTEKKANNKDTIEKQESKIKKANKTNNKSVASKKSTSSTLDFSTTLSDGKYTPTGFTFSGGTGKVTIKCSKITVTDGKAYGTIVFGSIYYSKLKTGGEEYTSTVDNKAKTSTFVVPVDLNAEQEIVGTTNAMSETHDVTYTIKTTLDEPVEDNSTARVDNSTIIPDATYSADSFKYSGGTGKIKITCSQIIISNGKAIATIVFSSPYYSQLKANGLLYKGEIDSKAKTSTYQIPIKLNCDNTIIGTTTAMTETHDITYTINAALTSNSKKITPNKDNGNGNNSKNNNSTTNKKKKLKNGTYKIKTEVTGKMFYIFPKDASVHYSILTVKNGKYKAVITLDGQGYDYVYMGTESQANKASRSTWSKYKAKNGFYSYTISVSKLDKRLNISGHSKKYNKWFGDRTIKFYSSTAKKVKSGTTTTGNKKNTNKSTSKKSSVVSSSATTASVNNTTTLKNGTYSPQSFSWSGGSGRLAYIKCSKITVKNGRSYATIVFSSSSYDALKASGTRYSKSGGGLSTFVIPIKLNTNNTIIGRTTAMSEAHWISYSIYAYIAGATSSGGSKSNSSASSTVKLSKTHLTKKAPTIVGLNYKSTTKIKKAKYFKIYNYDKGVKLIEIDVAKKTALYKKNAKTVMASSKSEIEYDEEGNAIGKSENEFTEEIYQNNVVNYLVVPKGVEIPAGLEKDIIIIHQPAKKTFTTSKSATSMLKDLDSTKLTKKAGKETDLNYRVIIKSKTDLAILSSAMLPAKVEKVSKINIFKAKTVKKQKAKAKSMKIQLQTVEKRFTALGVPVVINRSDNEKGKLAKAEWIKVYGAIYGSSKEANKIFNKEAR